MVMSLFRNGLKNILFLFTSAFWQVTKQQHCCRLTLLWTVGNTKYPGPHFPGKILLLTFHWRASHINAAPAAGQSWCSPPPTAIHASCQLNNVIFWLSAFSIWHSKDETFLLSSAQSIVFFYFLWIQKSCFGNSTSNVNVSNSWSCWLKKFKNPKPIISHHLRINNPLTALGDTCHVLA